MISTDNVFVPLVYSLTDDAPGYNVSRNDYNNSTEQSSNDSMTIGPICWKCRGIGTVIVKQSIVTCKVCTGSTRLKVKKPFLSSSINRPGEVTAITFPSDWSESSGNNGSIHLKDSVELKNGEQLCGLVGNWRIFQRVGGHRWTTDDIVTAWVAMKVQHIPTLININLKASNNTSNDSSKLKYLDLGCGNGSVLMMVSKHLPESVRCTGIEARQDAVELARRSIAYNCGPDNNRITVVNRDFRELYDNSEVTNSDPIINVDTKFELITGTPPYFRINYKIESKQDTTTKDKPSSVVSAKAIIQQGGMPTCKESAPARCEFRGGIEAYCNAAAAKLSINGLFVVCENWLNHDRVSIAIEHSGLHLCSIQRVCGKIGKIPLFCVYTCILKSTYNTLVTDINGNSEIDSNSELLTFLDVSVLLKPDLTVRDSDGAWTVEYANMLREMSYPVASLHPSGRY